MQDRVFGTRNKSKAINHRLIKEPPYGVSFRVSENVMMMMAQTLHFVACGSGHNNPHTRDG